MSAKKFLRQYDKAVLAFGRTAMGQAVYDTLMSHLSAKEVARRHKISREFVLKMRRMYPKMRPGNRCKKP